jgi:hypothetical protein
MMIHSNEHKLEEWIKQEIEEIKNIDDNVYLMRNKAKMMEFALHAKKAGGMNYIFEDNLFKDMEDKHLNTFKLYYYNFYLNATEQLEKDILTIQNYENHLNKFSEIKDFNERIELMEIKNRENYEVVSDLEERFLNIYDDLNKLKEISNLYIDIDKYISGSIEKAGINEEMMKNFNNFFNTKKQFSDN